MPSPLGHEQRDRKFLLRMTDAEDDFVRSLAKWRGTSLNEAITALIRDAKRRADEAGDRLKAEPPKTPERPPARGRRKGMAPRFSFGDLTEEQIPGQTSVTDPDQ